MRVILTSVSLILVGLLTACGGGGGGGSSSGDFNGAADVSVSLSPSEIDPGDRARILVDISDVNSDGIALKVRFPEGLNYVPATSFLVVDGDERDVNPKIESTKNNLKYLVYYFAEDDFGTNNLGTLRIELVGVDSVQDGEVEVDPDVDDPAVSNDVEFNVEEPAFTAETSANISVRD